jgi:hypothetical protein
MIFAKEFFDLQFSFAERVHALSGIPLERALFDYTNFYVRFGFGRKFDFDHEAWQSYLAGLRGAEDSRDWTYRFYLREPEARTAPQLVATRGCFAYALPTASHVRLHFRNAEADGRSPLAAARIEQRRADLAALFGHLKPTVSEDIPVVGASWLYNLKAYRGLFPAQYGSFARPVRGAFRSMALWGQFLDHRGEVRASMTRPFLRALAEQPSLSRMDECFPFRVLTARAAAREFYQFYAV